MNLNIMLENTLLRGTEVVKEEKNKVIMRHKNQKAKR